MAWTGWWWPGRAGGALDGWVHRDDAALVGEAVTRLRARNPAVAVFVRGGRRCSSGTNALGPQRGVVLFPAIERGAAVRKGAPTSPGEGMIPPVTLVLDGREMPMALSVQGEGGDGGFNWSSQHRSLHGG
jgi:hypothetical protein